MAETTSTFSSHFYNIALDHTLIPFKDFSLLTLAVFLFLAIPLTKIKKESTSTNYVFEQNGFVLGLLSKTKIMVEMITKAFVQRGIIPRSVLSYCNCKGYPPFVLKYN